MPSIDPAPDQTKLHVLRKVTRALPKSKYLRGADRHRLGLTPTFDQIEVVVAQDLWLEQPIDARWMAAFRIITTGGPPRVGEVRVFPLEPDFTSRPPGEWSGTWKGVAATAPRRGLTKDVLRRVRPSDVLRKTREIQRGIEKLYGRERVEVLTKPLGLNPPDSTQPSAPRPGRGRPSKGNEFYAQVASDYVDALKVGKAPVEALAKQHRGTPIQRIRGWVHRARTRGLLVGSTQGKAYGELSDAAIFILEAMKQLRPHRRTTRRK